MESSGITWSQAESHGVTWSQVESADVMECQEDYLNFFRRIIFLSGFASNNKTIADLDHWHVEIDFSAVVYSRFQHRFRD